MDGPLPSFVRRCWAGRGGDPENWDEEWRIRDKGRRRERLADKWLETKAAEKKTAGAAASTDGKLVLHGGNFLEGTGKRKLKCNRKKVLEFDLTRD